MIVEIGDIVEVRRSCVVGRGFEKGEDNKPVEAKVEGIYRSFIRLKTMVGNVPFTIQTPDIARVILSNKTRPVAGVSRTRIEDF